MSYLPSDTIELSTSQPVTVFPAEGGLYRRHGKRVLDILLALLLLPFALPVIAVLAAMVRRDGGPAFFAQPRVGLRGDIFLCWKIRTMTVNAEQVLEAFLSADAEAEAEWRTTQKLRRDPRVTPLGHVLRRTSLDELPQIFNVLCGEMSLIGPRPFTPDQRALYNSHQSDPAYYSLRPGITGAWQIGPRHLSNFTDRITYDNAYGRALSLRGDLLILLKTIRVVLRAGGS